MRGNYDLDFASERTESTLNLTRRALLAGMTGLTVDLAGCGSSGQTDPETAATETNAGGGDDGGSSDTSPGTVFDEIGFDGRELKVAVSDDSVARINTIRDGEQVGDAEFSTGVSKAPFGQPAGHCTGKNSN